MKVSRLWMAAAAAGVLAVGAVGVLMTGQRGAVAADDGPKVENFMLADQNLDSHELYQLTDAKAVVLITQMDACPIVRNSAGAYKALQDEYKAKGVEFFMLNSSQIDKREDIVQEAKEYGFTAPILLDVNQLVGEQLGVERTAEVYVIDPKTWKVAYKGPVDDRVTYERQKDQASENWAADALEAVIAGRKPAVSEKPAQGCLIPFAAREAAAKQPMLQVSYVKEVAPIIKDKCAVCHQPGGIGPMQFNTYDQVKAFAPMIRETLRTKRMPPWHADPSVGHFQDDKSLSPAQIKTLVHWVEQGAPRGSGEDPLAKVKFQAPEWPLGKPDLILQIPAYTIPAAGVVDYQTPSVANPLTEGKWIRASTIKVEQRQGVHHILTGYSPPGQRGGGIGGILAGGISVGGYAVGSESSVAPKDHGTFLPPGGSINFQNHYTPFGKQAVDHSQVGLYFYKEQPKLVMKAATILDVGLSIPAGAERHREVAYLTFPHDAILFSAFPHAHYRAHSSEVWLYTPDGKKQLLLSLPKYDFNWQRAYDFETPVKVPAGSKVVAITVYDNSKRNPANPDPNKTITWGEQSWNEMLFTNLRYRWVEETSTNRKDSYDTELSTGLFTIGMADDNLNGVIDGNERSALGGLLGGLLGGGGRGGAAGLLGGARGGGRGGAAAPGRGPGRGAASPPQRGASLGQAEQAVRLFDRNGDGRVDTAETAAGLNAMRAANL